MKSTLKVMILIGIGVAIFFGVFFFIALMTR